MARVNPDIRADVRREKQSIKFVTLYSCIEKKSQALHFPFVREEEKWSQAVFRDAKRCYLHVCRSHLA